MINAALKLGKTFYLLVIITSPPNFTYKESLDDDEHHAQNNALGIFPAIRQNVYVAPSPLLSFCGIMLGIGSSLSSHDVITLLPALGNPLLQAIFTWMSKVGSFAFSFLPVMFCIAIPLGLARENKGVAAFAGFVGYAVMNLAVNFWLTAKGILPTTDAVVLKANNVQNILASPQSIPASSAPLLQVLLSGCCTNDSIIFVYRMRWPFSAARVLCLSSLPSLWALSGWLSRLYGRFLRWALVDWAISSTAPATLDR
ncbi:PTS system, maltose and glucose-specific IIABC component [Salmonella bongori]|nr:PTS system, maltose and glucose-specific IIABC component [Salmonella bongori]